jgi:hypothetical protein
MAIITGLTPWSVVGSRPLGLFIMFSFVISIIAYLMMCVRILIYLLTQVSNGHILCVSTSAHIWLILLITFACFLFFIDIPLFCCMFSVEDGIISKRTYGFIVLFIIAILICLLSMIFMPSPGRDVLIFRIGRADKFVFQLEFNDETERIFTIFFNFNDQNLPEEFDGLNCTFVGVHDLCPTWGPLLRMNMTEFLKCPPDSNPASIWNNVLHSTSFSLAKDSVRGVSSSSASDMSILLIISTSMTISSLLMAVYRRFVSSDQWFDTHLEDFVERHRSSILGLMGSLVTDFAPTFLKSLFDDFPLTIESIE